MLTASRAGTQIPSAVLFTGSSKTQRLLRDAVSNLASQLAKLRQSFVLPGERRQWLAVVLRAGLLFALYAWVREFFFDLTKLDEKAYHQPSILLSALSRKEILAMVLLGGGVPLLRFRRNSWKVLGADLSVRILVLACVGTLAWALSTYDYNWYFDQWHTADRLLLVFLAALTFIHPAFVAPFVTLAAVMTHQFDHPMGLFSWTDKRLLFRLLMLFSSMLVIRSVCRIGNRTFLLWALCLHAESYLQPALMKIDLAWVSTNHLDHLPVSAHLNGWLPDMSQQTLLRIARALAQVNPILLSATLLVELAPVVTLLNPRLAKISFTACALLHAGIFLSSGILFWKWIIVNAALFGLVSQLPREQTQNLFGLQSRYFWISLLALTLFPHAFRTAQLGWIDTRLNNRYQVEAVAPDKTVSTLGPDYFAPYDMRFAQNRFSYLVQQPHIATTFGMLDDEDTLTALSGVGEPEEVLEVGGAHGRKHYSRKRTAAFDRFIKTFVSNRQESSGVRRSLGPIAAPHHIYMWASRGTKYRGDAIASVQVRWLTTWLQGYRNAVVRDKIVHRVSIP